MVLPSSSRPFTSTNGFSLCVDAIIGNRLRVSAIVYPTALSVSDPWSNSTNAPAFSVLSVLMSAADLDSIPDLPSYAADDKKYYSESALPVQALGALPLEEQHAFESASTHSTVVDTAPPADAVVLQASAVEVGPAKDVDATSSVTGPAPQDSLTPLEIIEPPTMSAVLAESDALRRLRMAAAFCTLFLAGWK